MANAPPGAPHQPPQGVPHQPLPGPQPQLQGGPAPVSNILKKIVFWISLVLSFDKLFNKRKNISYFSHQDIWLLDNLHLLRINRLPTLVLPRIPILKEVHLLQEGHKERR